MKKGISIWSFPAQTLTESFALAKDAGFEGVEVALATDGEVNLKSTEKELLKVKADAENAGIELYSVASGLYWDYWLTSDDKAEREKAKDIVRIQLNAAKTLGADTIIVVPGSVNADFVSETKVVDYKSAYERSLEAFLELREDAEKCGVAIGIENVWNKFLLSPLEMRDFVDAAGEGAYAYFDAGNVLVNGYPDHWIDILGKRICKVHVKDFKNKPLSFSV